VPLDNSDTSLQVLLDNSDTSLQVLLDNSDTSLQVPLDNSDTSMQVPLDNSDTSLQVPLDNSDAPPAQPTASSSHTQSDSSELSGLALSASLVSTGTPTVPALSPARYTPQATFTSAGAMGAVYNPSVSSPVSTTQTSAIVSSVIPGDASSSPPQPSAGEAVTCF